ncbi:formate-dependent phosphoribosylglycinamide formyltransferase [Blastomonas marina]|uniref:formate-dependent phosphoribosylglycinamide formyltransferase n=1 Tax=Blastomonas marina TaxID=1867408 RepID=UPI002AC91AB2|nr:formate-dependent phosphoribosylglycinamide formyltransferase [Blastomonas marina]WPZ04129.1 formate-dependent phosphoribosylglycinamide formyltransferase [Blastomonas marina]
MSFTTKILLLGSGELGREFVISAKRLGAYVIACDSYDNAPAMQVADAREAFSMLDGPRLEEVIARHKPDHVVPEVEAIRTEVLAKLEGEGVHIVPSAKAAQLTMNRDGIRDLAARELGVRTSTYDYAENFEQVQAAADKTGFPCVIKPVMSSSGKGQSTVQDAAELETAWRYAVDNMRGDRARVIVEQFVDFEYEITLLTVAHKGGVSFCPPIGHRQERGDYRESWQPAAMSDAAIAEAQAMAKTVVEALGGYGIFGVEFFVARNDEGRDEVIFSELSPRPHDTGMVTLVSQNLSEFDLHARAIMGLPVPEHIRARPAASAVILADRESEHVSYAGLAEAMADGADIRIFGKPVTRPWRRMGVALATGGSTDEARARATAAAGKVTLHYD